MTRLHFIRHGETNWNSEGRIQGQTDSQLNQAGREQAIALKESLASIPLSRVYASSSVRARDTAVLAFGHLPVEFIYLDELREIFLGDWEGQLYAEVERVYPDHMDHFRNAPHRFDYPGAETFAELQERGLTVVNDIIQENKSREVAIVSHGALIKSVLSHYEGRDLSAFWEPPRMRNCSHSIVEVLPGNDTPYIRQFAGHTEGFGVVKSTPHFNAPP